MFEPPPEIFVWATRVAQAAAEIARQEAGGRITVGDLTGDVLAHWAITRALQAIPAPESANHVEPA